MLASCARVILLIRPEATDVLCIARESRACASHRFFSRSRYGRVYNLLSFALTAMNIERTPSIHKSPPNGEPELKLIDLSTD